MTGGMVAFLMDSLYRYGKTKLISMQHEQSAAFAAEAYSRMTEQAGVVMATSGPGATNLITGIGSCFFDSSSVVFITGQVRTKDLTGRSGVRQQGFQEADIVSIVKPVTKDACLIREAGKIPQAMEKAFRLALEGRPGPVLVDIPIDIQQQEVRVSGFKLPRLTGVCPQGLEAFTDAMYKKLIRAKKPLILAGGGIRISRSRDLFLRWINEIHVPVVYSLMGVDVLPYRHVSRVGMIGGYGNRYANLAIKESDFLLVLGSRLDNKQTGSDLAAFRRNKHIYHVDCDQNQLNNRIKGCEAFCCDLRAFLNVAINDRDAIGKCSADAWKLRIESLRHMYPDTGELSCRRDQINPNQLIHTISRFSHSAIGYAVDVGQHQMWAAQSVELSEGQRFLASGGMGSMGFGLPAAIGMAFASPGKAVVLIAGDGGFQLSIPELETVRRNHLPIKMVVLNNHCLGLVRQFQQEHCGERYPATCEGYSSPDFKKISVAYNIPAKTIRNSVELERALRWLWRDPLSPALLNIEIPVSFNVYPKVKYRSSVGAMEFAK